MFAALGVFLEVGYRLLLATGMLRAGCELNLLVGCLFMSSWLVAMRILPVLRAIKAWQMGEVPGSASAPPGNNDAWFGILFWPVFIALSVSVGVFLLDFTQGAGWVALAGLGAALLLLLAAAMAIACVLAKLVLPAAAGIVRHDRFRTAIRRLRRSRRRIVAYALRKFHVARRNSFS